MVKNKMKIISLIILLIIFLLAPIVNAENETSVQPTTTEQVDPISETPETVSIRKGDVFLYQDNVTIDTPVDGNLFIFGNTVTINSQIGGDAFICANTLNIGEDAYILSNVFASATNIDVKGIIYNLYSIGDSLTIDGLVYRDVTSICDTLNINGMIGRNVFVNCSNIHFKEKTDNEENSSITSYGRIQGNLNYSAKQELSIPEGSVEGETHFSALNTNKSDISDYMYALGAVLVSAIVIWLIGLWISPRLSHNTNTSITVKKVLQIIGLGILVPIILALLSIILLFTPITIQLVVLLLGILVILFFISTSVTIININSLICNKLKITQNSHELGFLIITTAIFWLLTLIPYVGTVLSLLAIIWGIGSVSYSIFIKEKTDKTIKSQNKNEETNKN